LVENCCLYLHLKEVNGLIDLVLVKTLEPPYINEPLYQIAIALSVMLIESFRHRAFHDLDHTLHEEEVSIFKPVLLILPHK
jgi:hypothetical protein